MSASATRGRLHVIVDYGQIQGKLNDSLPILETLAKRYRNYGVQYHRYPKETREAPIPLDPGNSITDLAFVVSPTRELPNLITTLNMATVAARDAQAGVNERDAQKADSKCLELGLHILEIASELDELGHILAQYEQALEFMKTVERPRERNGRPQQVRVTADMAAARRKWEETLPDICQR